MSSCQTILIQGNGIVPKLVKAGGQVVEVPCPGTERKPVDRVVQTSPGGIEELVLFPIHSNHPTRQEPIYTAICLECLISELHIRCAFDSEELIPPARIVLGFLSRYTEIDLAAFRISSRGAMRRTWVPYGRGTIARNG